MTQGGQGVAYLGAQGACQGVACQEGRGVACLVHMVMVVVRQAYQAAAAVGGVACAWACVPVVLVPYQVVQLA